MRKVLWFTGIVSVLLLAGVFLLLTKSQSIKSPGNITTDCPTDWQTYRHEVLGIEFCYPPEWGKPKTVPVENLTTLQGVADEYSKDEHNAYANSVFISFSNIPANEGVLHFFNDEYGGEYYKNARAYDFGYVDNIAKLKQTGNICDYKIDFNQKWGEDERLSQIWNNCADGTNAILTEDAEYYDFNNINQYLYTYELDGYAYKKLQNGLFNNLLVEFPFESIVQNKEKLTSINQFFNKTKNWYNPNQAKTIITQDKFKQELAELTTFVGSIKTFVPSTKKTENFEAVAGENSDITAIRHYYYYLANGQLEAAFKMHSESLDFGKFKDQYKNIVKAAPRDFTPKGNGQYDFFVDYAENNSDPTIYHVIMKVQGQRIQTQKSEEVISNIASFANLKAYARIMNGKCSMVILDGDKETIAKEASADYNSDYSNLGSVARYGKPAFSNDGRYLHFESYGWEYSASNLYDIEKRKIIAIIDGTKTYGFTDNQKYFYACSDPGMGSGSGEVISLPDGKVIFDLLKDNRIDRFMNYNCSYVPGDNSVKFTLSDYSAQEGQPVKTDQIIQVPLN